MSIKICSRGHLTGFRECPQCPSAIISASRTIKGPSGTGALDKKWKARVTQAIRDSGQVPVKDL